MKAIVEILVSAGNVEKVQEALKKINGVKESYSVTGHCDIIAIIEAPDFKTITNIIIRNIHKINGVERTETLLVSE